MGNNHTEDMLAEEVEANIRTLEEAESGQDVGVLDVVAEVTLRDATIQEITVTLTTGGPHVEVELGSQNIVGYWTGERVRRDLSRNEEVQDVLSQLWNRFKNELKRKEIRG